MDPSSASADELLPVRVVAAVVVDLLRRVACCSQTMTPLRIVASTKLLLVCPHVTLLVGGGKGFLVGRALVVRTCRRHQGREAVVHRRRGKRVGRHAGRHQHVLCRNHQLRVDEGGGTSESHSGVRRVGDLLGGALHGVRRGRTHHGRTDGEQHDESEHDPESLHLLPPWGRGWKHRCAECTSGKS